MKFVSSKRIVLVVCAVTLLFLGSTLGPAKAQNSKARVYQITFVHGFRKDTAAKPIGLPVRVILDVRGSLTDYERVTRYNAIASSDPSTPQPRTYGANGPLGEWLPVNNFRKSPHVLLWVKDEGNSIRTFLRTESYDEETLIAEENGSCRATISYRSRREDKKFIMFSIKELAPISFEYMFAARIGCTIGSGALY